MEVLRQGIHGRLVETFGGQGRVPTKTPPQERRNKVPAGSSRIVWTHCVEQQGCCVLLDGETKRADMQEVAFMLVHAGSCHALWSHRTHNPIATNL